MTRTEWDQNPTAQKKTWVYLSVMGLMLTLLWLPPLHLHRHPQPKPPARMIRQGR